MHRRRPRPTLFPYTTLFRSRLPEALRTARALVGADPRAEIHVFTDGAFTLGEAPETSDPRIRWVGVRSEEHTSDSSHRCISYAVFCLKKKKNYTNTPLPSSW